MTIEEVIAEVDRQLAWRGPADRPQGYIVLTRDAMQVLIDHVKELRGRP